MDNDNKKEVPPDANKSRWITEKYTVEITAKIVAAVGFGATLCDAAGYGGISETLLHKWIRDKPDFAARIKAAEGAGMVQMVSVVRKAALGGDWHAAAWILERRNPGAYGRRDRVALTGADGGPIQLASVIFVPGLAATLDDWQAQVAAYQAASLEAEAANADDADAA